MTLGADPSRRGVESTGETGETPVFIGIAASRGMGPRARRLFDEGRIRPQSTSNRAASRRLITPSLACRRWKRELIEAGLTLSSVAMRLLPWPAHW